MSNIENINTTHTKTLLFRSEEAQVLGMNGALVLNQIRYWTDPKRSKNYKEDRYWAYNSLQAWHAQLPTLSERTLRRVFKHLETLGVLMAKRFNAWRRDQRKWHTINFEKLTEILQSMGLTPSRRRRVSDSSLEEGPEIDVKETLLRSQQPKLSIEEKKENGRNLDVANLAISTCGQFGHMSKDTILTQEITSPTSQTQNNEQDPLREMITIWNKNIENDSEILSLSYWRRRTLRKTLKHSFQNNLADWKHYCQLIAHNTFLMGGGPNQWKVSLDWALKPQNIQKVQEKRYTGQKELPQQPPVFSKDDLQGSEVWKTMACLLAQRLGASIFNAWFAESCLKDETSEHPILSLGTSFKADYVQQRFGSVIEATAKEVMAQMKSLRLTS